MAKNIENMKEYMAEYGKRYRAAKMARMLKRGAGKPPNYSLPYIEDKYLIEKHKYTPLVVYPTGVNFNGTELDNPIVCSEFGCNTHLTPEQQLYGTKCIHHQKQKKIDVAKYISHPIKKTA